MIWFYLFILYTLGVLFTEDLLVLSQETKKAVYDNHRFCNKSWFMKEYFNKSRYINLDMLKQSCKDSLPCNCNVTSSASLREDRLQGTSYLRIEIKKSHSNQSCWGYGVEMVSVNNQVTQYLPVKDNLQFVELKFSLNTKYAVRIMALPNGNMHRMNWTSPGRCELEVVHDTFRKMEGKNVFQSCKKKLSFRKQMKFARKLCGMNINPDKRREQLRDDVIIKNCELIIVPKKASYSRKIMIVLSITAVVFVAIILIFVYLTRKKRFLLKQTPVKIPVDQKGPSSVMIIHRPGCEILDELVHELRAILMSYGITVKGTLVDQNILDAEGGIASYLQRNIKDCDHVLVLLTQKDDELIIGHRPYEFAVRLLEGLALHDDKSSSYIPLYLNSYYESVHLFPSFLQASTSYGYRIPQETLRLLCKVLDTVKLEHSKEREAKDRVFLNNMKKLLKNYSKDQHMTCCKSHCSKGMQYPSASNLSSIWASTVNTKWPSFESINERKNVLDSISEQNQDFQENYHEKTLKYLQNTTDINTDNHSDHEVFLDDSKDVENSRPYTERAQLLPSTCSSSNATELTECKYSTQSSESGDGILCENQRLFND